MMRCRNPECGLHFLFPPPDAETLAVAYHDYYTHRAAGAPSRLRRLYLHARESYLRRRFGYPRSVLPGWLALMGSLLAAFPLRRAAMDSLVLWTPFHSAGRLLEIGCGNGERLSMLQRLGWAVTGIEPDAAAAELAHASGLDVRVGTLDTAGLPAGSFDAILMSHVIEHVSDPRETIAECHRLLRPGGRLTMLTPNIDSLGHRWFGRHWLHLDPPRHLHLFGARSLARFCRLAGFAEIEWTTTMRDADWTLGNSLAIRHRGHYRIGSLPPALRLLGRWLAYVEYLAVLAARDKGEELLLTACRPSSPCNLD